MNRFLPWLGYLPFLDADAGGGSGDAGQGTDPNSGDAGDGNDDGEKVYRTQADFDKAFEDRLKRERRKLQAEIEAKIKADADKAAMSEAELLKAEKAEVEKRAQETLATANDRMIRAEVRATAAELQIVDANDAYTLMAKDDIAVDDEGNVTGVKKALEALLAAKPYLKKPESNGASRSGGQFTGNGADLSKRAEIEKQLREAKTRPERVRLQGELHKLNRR